MSRIHSRQTSGRFRRATLENTFGLRTTICQHCGAFNPSTANAPAPTTCEQCGASLSPPSGDRDPDANADALDLQGEQ